MSDRDAKDLTLGLTATPPPKMKAGEKAQLMVAMSMEDGGLDPAQAKKRAECKAAESKVWLGRAAICFGFAGLVALIIVGVGLFVVVKVTLASGSFPVATAAIFGVAVILAAGLPALAGLGCATQASAEWVRTTLGFLPMLGRLPFIGKFFQQDPPA